jgi:predicted permease
MMSKGFFLGAISIVVGVVGATFFLSIMYGTTVAVDRALWNVFGALFAYTLFFAIFMTYRKRTKD